MEIWIGTDVGTFDLHDESEVNGSINNSHDNNCEETMLLLCQYILWRVSCPEIGNKAENTAN